MQHCVTVWAYWNQILFVINFVILSNRVKRFDMMDMNKRISHFSVELLEIESANLTVISVTLDTLCPCHPAALILVYRHLLSQTLVYFELRRYKFGKKTVRIHIISYR